MRSRRPLARGAVSSRITSAALLCIVVLAAHGQAQTGRLLPEGPWGNVELEPIKIRLPAIMIPDAPLPLLPWLVERDKPATARLFADIGIEPTLAERILSTYRDESGGTLRPTVEMIRALDTEPRARLYDVLRERHQNSGQRNPHRFRRDRLAERRAQFPPLSTVRFPRLISTVRSPMPFTRVSSSTDANGPFC